MRKQAYNKIIDYSKLFLSVDEKLAGVINYGKDLKNLDIAKDWDLDSTTVRNSNYWRASMERVPDEPTVIFSNAYLCVIKGYFSRAKIWLLLGKIGMSEKFRDDFINLIKWVKPIERNIGLDIQKGISFHDKGKFSEAIKIYDEVITNFPYSAWAYYEKSYSFLCSSFAETETLREKLYQKARHCDPFYFQAYQGSKEDVINRKLPVLISEVLPFIQASHKSISDFEKFAYGCEKLEFYDFAAQAFWKLLHYVKNTREIMIHYFSDLKKLGLDSFVSEMASEDIVRVHETERKGN